MAKKVLKKRRTYDNSGRSQSSTGNQLRIIETLVELLAQRRGGEVQIQEIAEKTGITKRTIFRFFKDKKSMHEAMDEYLVSYLSAGAQQLVELNFVDFAKNAVRLFEENEAITMAYVLSPFGNEARAVLRKKLNQIMLEKITAEYGIKINKANLPRLAIIVNMVNAKIWYDLKTEHDLSAQEIGESLGWAIESLFKNFAR